jgi:hypothetical protein
MAMPMQSMLKVGRLRWPSHGMASVSARTDCSRKRIRCDGAATGNATQIILRCSGLRLRVYRHEGAGMT